MLFIIEQKINPPESTRERPIVTYVKENRDSNPVNTTKYILNFCSGPSLRLRVKNYLKTFCFLVSIESICLNTYIKIRSKKKYDCLCLAQHLVNSQLKSFGTILEIPRTILQLQEIHFRTFVSHLVVRSTCWGQAHPSVLWISNILLNFYSY